MISTSRRPVPTPKSLLESGDRGPAAFFHGRSDELEAFHRVLNEARKFRGGTTFLVQGAPGVGKTALLDECRAQAIADGWCAAHISPRALHDPAKLARHLNESHVTRSSQFSESGGNGGATACKEASAHHAKGHSVELQGPTVGGLLMDAALPNGLLLILDEAQNLEIERRRGEDVEASISELLDEIHNGRIGAPVVLLAGGLGTTDSVFEELGTVRFSRQNCRRLDSLDIEPTRAVIEDWLVHAGCASTETPYFARWASTLAAGSFGWPQHIHIYAQAGAQWLYDNGGELTFTVPNEVLETARAERGQYYKRRVKGFRPPHRTAFADLLRKKGMRTVLLEDEVVTALQSHQSREEALDMFRTLLRKGVIAETSYGHLRVPIPSMHDWLVEQSTK